MYIKIEDKKNHCLIKSDLRVIKVFCFFLIKSKMVFIFTNYRIHLTSNHRAPLKYLSTKLNSLVYIPER